MLGKLRNMTSLYIIRGDEMLMLYRIGSRVVDPSWCGIGGHFEDDELNDALRCVLREANEEIGISEDQLENLKHRYVTLRNKNGEIRQNYYFFAELKPGVEINTDCNEGELRWVKTENVLEKNMPFTAWYMMEHYLKIGRYNDILYGGITTKDGVEFVAMED